MKKTILTILAATLSLVLVACSSPVSAEFLKSDKARDISPSSSGLSALVQGNSAFALDLYQALKAQNDGNMFYSPYSLSLALAMAYAGARSDTASEMADTLHFTLPGDALHAAFNYLALELDKRRQGAASTTSDSDKGFHLNVVNDAWGQKNFQFLASYLDTLAVNYGAGLRILDFIKDAEGARKAINDYISDQTRGKIKDLIPQGAVTDLTRLVLTNAIYFKAAWESPFAEGATGGGTFKLLDGGQVNVSMMHQGHEYNYVAGTGYQAIELPYDGGQLSMVVLLPDQDQFNVFQDALKSEFVDGIISSMNQRNVILSLPKFQYDSSFGLKQALAAMGMQIAFTDSADFSGMMGTKGLFISDVVHKAFVSVDEAGTEAAAASAVIVGTTSMPSNTITLSIDRPFIFLIRDIPTGTILFVGRVMNPAV
ncbi:MAG: serpin family protein [Dehalococcoidia bacterium]|nr:MAG: serpin family protein [Dehalococcoidia bacterium]